MPDFDVKEKRFEQDIEEYLLTYGGYQKGNPAAFNREKAMDTGTFLSFIRSSQPKQWERFEKIYGADSERQLIDRFCREVKLVGLLKVLRQGFTDRGIKFRAVFWKPETSINETSQAQYAANILHCTRQLHYSLSNENSIDIVLLLNGIPVVSMELKCQFTGQDTANAIQQYKFDRVGKDAIFEFKNRVLVHFAVDLTIARGLDYYTGTVYETTMLDHPEIGSICSGGRYDNLAEYYTDKQLPGVGISIGLTRLFSVLEAQGYLNEELLTAPADVLILPMTEDLSTAISFVFNCTEFSCSLFSKRIITAPASTTSPNR